MDLTTRRTTPENTESFPNDTVSNNNSNSANGNKGKISKSIFSIRSIMDVDDDHQSPETINHNLQGEFLFKFYLRLSDMKSLDALEP